MDKLIKKFIIWYFLRQRQTAVFEIDNKFVVRIFSKDFYNNDVTEALREYRWRNQQERNED